MERRWLICLLMAVVLALAVQAVAQESFVLEGKYQIKGWDPGNDPTGRPDYEGSAVLTRWGGTFRYHGFMDNMTYAGAAIFDPRCGTLSLSFTNGDGTERGVTHLRIMGDYLEGHWAMDNGGQGELGYEIWTKK